MTTTEKIQVLQNAYNNLQTQLNNVSSQVNSNTTNLQLHLLDCQDDINTINGRLGVLSSEDDEIHQEIHQVAVQTDDNTSRLNNIDVLDVSFDSRLDALEAGNVVLQGQITEMDNEHHSELHSLSIEIDNIKSYINTLGVNDVNYGERLDNLEQNDVEIVGEMTEMDNEIHQEIHLIANDLDNTKTRINKLEIFEAETPDFIVLSEAEFEALGTPDYDTFYYVYEED